MPVIKPKCPKCKSSGHIHPAPPAWKGKKKVRRWYCTNPKHYPAFGRRIPISMGYLFIDPRD